MTAILVGIESSIASETAIQTIQGMEV